MKFNSWIVWAFAIAGVCGALQAAFPDNEKALTALCGGGCLIVYSIFSKNLDDGCGWMGLLGGVALIALSIGLTL